MDKNLALSINNFLKNYPPFYFFEADILARLAEHVIEQHHPQGELLFHQGDMPGTVIFIVRQGAVDLYREDGGSRQLIDQCDEGELFGLRPLMAEDAYALTAITAEETVLYTMPVEAFRSAMEKSPKVLLYIASNFASGWQWGQVPGVKEKLLPGSDHSGSDAFQLLEIQTIEQNRLPVTCDSDQTIRQAAMIMTEREVGSIIIVDSRQHPLGIVTDKDLRKKIATGREHIETPIAAIMSSPLITAPPAMTVADVQMEMVKHRINHLILTKDGTSDSPVVGVLTEHDLMIVQGNNPAVLIREIKRAKNIDELKQVRDRAEILLEKYLYQEVAISYIVSIITEINDALLLRLIRMAETELDESGEPRPKAGFCWMALGSEGRREQLLRTDQDNALVFEDVPEDQLASTRAYYQRLGQRVNDLLFQCGFAYCPGEMMAGNPKWCLSLKEWKRQFTEWILEPEPLAVMHCTVFFDYRPVYGMDLLTQELTSHIFKIIHEQKLFFIHLAKNALETPPPLTFFRDFMVERSGEHKDEFDIKKRAMLPLTDAARVLTLHHQIPRINNTFRRFQELARREPSNKELYEQAADSYEILIRFRTLQGLKNNNSGRYFKPSELTKMERILLRNVFRPIQDLQLLIKTRFQLGFF